MAESIIKKCAECIYFKDKSNLCDASPDEIQDITCFLRCILWVLLMAQEDENSS